VNRFDLQKPWLECFQGCLELARSSGIQARSLSSLHCSCSQSLGPGSVAIRPAELPLGGKLLMNGKHSKVKTTVFACQGQLALIANTNVIVSRLPVMQCTHFSSCLQKLFLESLP